MSLFKLISEDDLVESDIIETSEFPYLSDVVSPAFFSPLHQHINLRLNSTIQSFSSDHRLITTRGRRYQLLSARIRIRDHAQA